MTSLPGFPSNAEAPRSNMEHVLVSANGRTRVTFNQYGAQITSLERDGKPLIRAVAEGGALHGVATDKRPAGANDIRTGETRKRGNSFLSLPFDLYGGPVHGAAGAAYNTHRYLADESEPGKRIVMTSGGPDSTMLLPSLPSGQNYGIRREVAVDQGVNQDGTLISTELTSFCTGPGVVPAFGEHSYFAISAGLAQVRGARGLQTLEQMHAASVEAGVVNNNIDIAAGVDRQEVPGQLVLLPDGEGGPANLVQAWYVDGNGERHDADFQLYNAIPDEHYPEDDYLAIEPFVRGLELTPGQKCGLYMLITPYDSLAELEAQQTRS